MEVSFVAPDLRKLDALKCEAIALPFFEDERPLRGALGLVDWRLAGLVSRVLVRGHACGEDGDKVLLPTKRRLPFEKLFLFGAGPKAELDEARFEAVTERMLETLDAARVRSSVIALPGRAVGRIDPEVAMQRFLRHANAHPEQDSTILIEDADAQKAMQPVLERERRRAQAELEP